jgi:hypothetical protein
MKKIWLTESLLIILIVISAGCVVNQSDNPNHTNVSSTGATEQPSSQHLSQSAAIIGSVSHSMILNLPAKKTYPEKNLVYKTDPPNVSRSRLDEYAKKFNVSGTFRDGENAMSLQTEDLVYGVEVGKASGNVIYNVAHRPNDILDSPDKLPSDDEAAKIAMRFLKEKDLYPDGAFLRKIEHEYARSTDKNGKEILHNGRIVVWFGRTLNNLEVKGTQLDVEICGNGDVTEYFANWREYTPTKEYPLKSPETAFEELKQEGIRTSMSNPSISINNVTLAYRTKAGAYKEEYLEPVWVFSGVASSDNAPSESVSKYMTALTDEAVKSLSPS